MISRRSCAPLVLLTLSLGAWQMGDVFVGYPVSRTNFPRCRLRVKAMPMDNEEPLKVGALVGYELEVPLKFFHTGIYLGPGNSQLEEETGRRLNRDMHYVIEYSGPTRFSGAPPSSQVGKVTKGKGGQNIWITPMEPSTEWCVIEIHSDEYGKPHSGNETRRRALSKVGSSFGGYDALRNNCQHFAVWARYGIKNMILGDAGKRTIANHLGGMAAFAAAGMAGCTPLVIGVWLLAAANLVTAKTGLSLYRKLKFKDPEKGEQN